MNQKYQSPFLNIYHCLLFQAYNPKFWFFIYEGGYSRQVLYYIFSGHFLRFIRTYQRFVFILVAFLALAIIFTAYTAINNIVAEQSKIQQQAMSPVFKLVNEELLNPLYIAITVGEASFFNEKMDTKDIDEEALFKQLRKLEERLGLTFFVASEKARKQYMSNGRTLELVEGEVYWYFEALEQEKDLLADLGQVGDVHLFFDVKIYNDNREFLGFVGIGKRIQVFLNTFEKYKQQYGYDFLFINEKNDILLSSIPELVVTDEHVPHLSSLPWFSEQDLELQSLDNLLVSVNNEDFLISEIEIPELEWKLLLLVPLHARQAQITQSFIINTALALSIVVLLLVAAFYAMVVYKRHLEKRTEVDPLSGLPNRAYIQRRFAQLRRKNSDICLVLADLDHFKKINDSFGHNAGDHIIQEASKILTEDLRRQDLVGRWGGEEFIMLLPDASLRVAEAIAKRACKRLQQTDFVFEKEKINITASFGVSTGNTEENLSKILGNADVALYEAKRNGRNKVEVYRA